MKTWLEPLQTALEGIETEVRFYFRDDDAGWCHDRLLKVIDCFSEYALPMDLAAIPQALNPRDTVLLRNRIEKSKSLIGIHQHGNTHFNHQRKGRNSEFGSYRSYDQQKFDIWMGKNRLYDLFGERVDNIFTPPWNRCNQDTIEALIDLGFASISRDASAQPLNTGPLVELPVHIDWFKKQAGRRLKPVKLGLLIGATIRKKNPIGIMLHHAQMDRNERSMLNDLLSLLHSYSNAQCKPMRALVESYH